MIEEGTAAELAIESEVKASLFRNFFALLEQKNIPYAILSNYFAYPVYIHSDIDFVVPEPHRASMPALLQRFCIENDAHLLQISEYINTSAFSCFIATIRDSSLIHMRFDVCSDDHRRDKLIFPWQFLLDGRVRYLDSFFVPAPEKSLIHYLLKHIDKRFLEGQHLRTLYKWYKAAPKEAEQLLSRYWPSDYRQILSCIVNQVNPDAEWLELWSRKVQLSDARQTFSARARQYLKEVRRKVRRITKPTGFLISFLGPDGCGKSTAIIGVKKALHPAFGQTAEFHLLPRVLHRGRKDDDTAQPHAKTPRSPLTSLAKTLLWFVDLWVGYWVKLKPKMVRSTLIIFDRYIHDLQVDRRRYRYAGPQWWPRLLGKLSPKPDLWILLDAPPEVLWQRKAELTREESARQREAYRQFIIRNQNAAMIDANQSPEMVVVAVCSEVFRHLAARTAERYSLPTRGF